jgi:hypothetical protein
MGTAIQWAVYPALSTDVMIATGITDKPAAARSVVEAVMTLAPNSAWGELVRIGVPGKLPADAELSEWPSPGEVYICRRTTNDGKYKWMPLFPLHQASSAGVGTLF